MSLSQPNAPPFTAVALPSPQDFPPSSQRLDELALNAEWTDWWTLLIDTQVDCVEQGNVLWVLWCVQQQPGEVNMRGGVDRYRALSFP
jgi:hypothetical protein